MQITLLASDVEIHTALNQLIWSEELTIPDGEIRSARIVNGGSGPLGIRVQASRLGVRFEPPDSYLQLRLGALINNVYSTDVPQDGDRLRWLLRSHEGESGQERLTSALTTSEPLDLVRRLLTADERAYQDSLSSLGLPVGRFDNESDEFLAELIAWHVGFSFDTSSAELRHVRAYSAELRQLVQSLPIDALDRHQMSDLRAIAGKLFPALEGALKRTLRFSAWAMLRDHYSEGPTLIYSDADSEAFVDSWIKPYAEKLDTDRVAEMALADLLSSFGIFGKHLRNLPRQRSEFARDRSDYPRSVRDWKSPFIFPFQHTLPYLDLDSASQATIAETITKVSSGFSTEKVLSVRNALLHDSDEFPGVESILRAINEVDARLGTLVATGLYPVEFTFVGSESDSVGRERVRLRSTDGTSDFALLRPSPLSLVAFPRRRSPQIVVRSARIKDTPEPLRFTHRRDSEFRDRWANFPRRPKRRLSFTAEGAGR